MKTRSKVSIFQKFLLHGEIIKKDNKNKMNKVLPATRRIKNTQAIFILLLVHSSIFFYASKIVVCRLVRTAFAALFIVKRRDMRLLIFCDIPTVQFQLRKLTQIPVVFFRSLYALSLRIIFCLGNYYIVMQHFVLL